MRPQDHRAPGRRRGALLRHHLRRRPAAAGAARAVRHVRSPSHAPQARRARRQAHRRRRHRRARRRRPHRLAAGQARRPLEADRPRPHRCCRALQAARAPPTHRQHAGPRPRRGRRRRRARQAPRSAASTSTAPPRRRGTGPGSTATATGCGGTLGAGRLGVAHKSLPCGTMVTFKRGDRSVRVPVIDRGPYVGGREYDLTAATAQRLGFEGHGAILDHPLERRSVQLAATAAARRRSARRAPGSLERRHPHAEQPHGPRRRVGAQQLERDAASPSRCRSPARAACARGSPWSSRRAGP